MSSPVVVPNSNLCSANSVSPADFALKFTCSREPVPLTPWADSPRCTESPNFTRCVINAAPLKEGCAAISFQKISFADIEGFKRSRGRKAMSNCQPAKSKTVFCADVEGKGIAYGGLVTWEKSVANTGICNTVYSVPGSNPKKGVTMGALSCD